MPRGEGAGFVRVMAGSVLAESKHDGDWRQAAAGGREDFDGPGCLTDTPPVGYPA
ncbi:MAG: hypothetical protein ACYSVY_19490 [Planctomycetota bacterium]